MKIVRKALQQGAEDARGLVVVIDVFRAFTCAPMFFHMGARRLLLEEDPDRAVSLKKEIPDSILVGEVNEVPIEGSDAGNSPSEILRLGEEFFKGRVVIHRTTAGVRGAVAAHKSAQEVVAGSFVMARAIADYILHKNPDTVTIVAMGDRAKAPAPEDEACAHYLEHLLCGTAYDHLRSLENIVFQPTAQKFIQGLKPYLPPEDPIFCLQRDIFDMVLRVEKKDQRLYLVPVEG